MLKALLIASVATLSLAPAALADHKNFHVECGEGPSAREAIDSLHNTLHRIGAGTYTLGSHGVVDVDTVSAITVTPSDDGSLACVVVNWLKAGQQHDHGHDHGRASQNGSVN